MKRHRDIVNGSLVITTAIERGVAFAREAARFQTGELTQGLAITIRRSLARYPKNVITSIGGVPWQKKKEKKW